MSMYELKFRSGYFSLEFSAIFFEMPAIIFLYMFTILTRVVKEICVFIFVT